MEWRFVRQPNGRLARFSDIVDSFTHGGLTKKEAVKYCMNRGDFTPMQAAEKVRRGMEEDRWQDSIDTIVLINGWDHLRAILGEMGLDASAPENQPRPGVQPASENEDGRS